MLQDAKTRRAQRAAKAKAEGRRFVAKGPQVKQPAVLRKLPKKRVPPSVVAAKPLPAEPQPSQVRKPPPHVPAVPNDQYPHAANALYWQRQFEEAAAENRRLESSMSLLRKDNASLEQQLRGAEFSIISFCGTRKQTVTMRP